MSKESEHKKKLINEAISKTGFLLERRVSDLLEQEHWSVINNRYYVDALTNTPREIDLVAYKTSQFERIINYVVLLISCKKTEGRDWVFLTKPVKDIDPNFNKCPQTVWTNSGILQVLEVQKNFAELTVNLCEDLDYFRNLFELSRNVYAFQEVDTKRVKAQNDKAIY
ncbi:MAG: hypothetical protein FVQ80_14375 [Planctomycetes bacterium]|nr:hypothetical protein [Planctomycetota bacterium]